MYALDGGIKRRVDLFDRRIFESGESKPPRTHLGPLYRRGRQLLGRGSPPKNGIDVDHHDVSPIGRCAVAERALSITRQLWRLGPISISPSQGAVQSLFEAGGLINAIAFRCRTNLGSFG